jgi:hypothetical protein
MLPADEHCAPPHTAVGIATPPKLDVMTTTLAPKLHAGYFELRLCPLNGTTDAAEKKAFSEACFAKHPLKAKLPNGRIQTKYWMYKSGAWSPVVWRFRST